MVLRNGSALSESLALSAASDEPSTSQPIRVDELDHYDEDWIRPFPLKDGVKIRKGEKFSDYYTLYEEIGEGKFGKVYRCIEKATGLTLAAKCIKIRKDTDFEKVEKEVNIMTQMRHKCIAQIYDAFATDSNDVILIMEIVQGGELFDRVADDSYILTEMAVALIMFQICEAIRYIHSQNIIHLDLKPENIMCVSQTSNKIKLIDFGLAQWYDGSKDLIKRILPDECLRHCWLLKNRERAALAGAASRAISPALLPCEQQPLAVEKLRSYVKNKKFRRLVFGVLFVNSVMRMLRTLQQNKSSHGIDYVKEEINIVKENEEKPQTLPTTRRKIKKEKERNNGEDLAKKRSKSEARRTGVDQQRTRSSTEHTSTKKQRQDNEEEGTGGNIKKISKSSISKFGLNEEKNLKPKTEEKQNQPKNKSPQPATKNFGINVMKLAQNLEEEVTPKQQINALTKIKQQEEEENHQKVSPKNSFVTAIPLKKEDNLIVKSPKVERKIPINWREEVAMRAEEEGKYVADDLNPYERERSHTTTEKRKKLVKRKVNKLNGLNHLRQQRISKKFVKSSNSMDESPVVGHDVFDFRLLRMKLQNRIMGYLLS
uniref:Protein kinase domain-containing protein n=1 Tax=Meloidogyne javanica TaxID=6303 RepID=A0A915LG35_MELJA